MLSVSYAGKNAYSAGKTSGVLRGGASEPNRWYVVAQCFLDRSEFRQKLIGYVISELRQQKCV